MSDLAERRQREWRSRAVRELLELENLAKSLRDRLENSSTLGLEDLIDESSDLNSHVMTFITYVDRSAGLVEAGL